MRTFVLSLTLVITALSLNARRITPDEASAAASDLLNSDNPQLVTNDKGMAQAPANGKEALESPYYIFNKGNNGGFVIISGDDRVQKVLGYSDKGNFDATNIPPQLKDLMEQWATQISQLSESDQHPSWQNNFPTRAGEGVLLETANWGQGYPYNLDCPVVDGVNCVTGCVATAMAIAMKYHNWPEGYDWDSLPMTIEQNEENPAPANPELARLMKDAGEAVFMDYHPSVSGAQINWVGHRMQQVFKYSPKCQYITSGNFSNEDWVTMLYSNLDNGNPVIYSGIDEEGLMSHAFIIDGYNDSGYHVNWGWDGLYNGYFALEALTPNEFQDFSFETGMVINIEPDKNGIEYSDCFVDYGYLWNAAGHGVNMNISVENVVKDQPFHVIESHLTIPPFFNGEIGIALVSEDNTIKEILQSNYYSSDNEPASQNLSLYGLRVSKDIQPTDRLQLVSKKQNDSNFKLILGTLEWSPSVGVANNKPEFGKVTFNIGENIDFYYYDGIPNDNSKVCVPQGVSEANILKGMGMIYVCSPQDTNSENPAILTVTGPLLYGDIIMADKNINYSLDVWGDHEITVKMADLKDETINLLEAGSLKDSISKEEAMNIRNLTISGNMNALDFWYIRDNCPCIKILDLKNVNIQEVTASDGNFVVNPVNCEANVIPEWALTNLHSSNIERLILPDNLVGINGDSFVGFKIRSISIPSGVQSIGNNVFYNNQNLEFIQMLNPEPVDVHDCIFTCTKCPYNGTLFVPVGSLEKYKAAPVWGQFKNIVEGDMPHTVILEVDSVQLQKDDSVTLSATVLPEDAPYKTVSWSSDNPSITVDANGKVTPYWYGEATITAACGSGIASCKVNVVEPQAESITLSQDSAVLKVGETIYLTATVLPENATDKTVTWTSSNEAVASVDAYGNVTAVTIGDATITAACGDVTASCNVTVVPIPAEKVTISQENVELKVGENCYLSANVEPWNTTDKTVTWTSGDESVAIVSAEGIVTAVSLGSTSITAACGEASATCAVTVVATPVSGVYPNEYYKELKVGEQFTFTANVQPDNATDKTVTWTSSDESVATIDGNGTATALSVGTTQIVAHCGGLDSSAATLVVLPIPVETVSISQETAELIEGDTITLTATVLPEDATDKTVTWRSDNPSIATVDSIGNVTAISVGTTTITATTPNWKTATCAVTVKALVVEPEVILAESLSITPDVWTGEEGSTFSIAAVVLPETATDKTLLWESSDVNVATVDSIGNVSVLKEGSCVITVSTADGSELTAQCAITSLAGIDLIFSESDAKVDVYNLNGILIRKECTREDLKQLTPAIYILRQGGKVATVFINK